MEFIPKPHFLLRENLCAAAGEQPYSFKYQNQYLNLAPDDEDEPENFLAVNLKIGALTSAIKVDDIPGVSRDIWTEVYLPFQVFQHFAVSQPAWFLLQADNENPNDDHNSKKTRFSSISQHVCLGYINPQPQKIIMVSPTLKHYYQNCAEVWVSPLKICNQRESLADFLHCPISLSADGGIQPLTSITLEVINGESNENEMLNYFKSNPKVVQIGDFIVTKNEIYKLSEGKYSEDTSYIQKILDTDIQLSQKNGKKVQVINSIKQKISQKYFKAYEDKVVNETYSFNQYSSYLIHCNYLKQVSFLSNPSSIDIPRGLQNFTNTRLLQLNCQKISIAEKITLLIGLRGSGKTTILKDLADKMGLIYTKMDCIYHLTIPGMKKMLQEMPKKRVKQLVEITNFEKYGFLDTGNQNKELKDIQEMRLIQIFEENLQENCQYVISVERLDNLPEFMSQNFKNKCVISYPDKNDRILILGEKYQKCEKYLQGKTIKEIKNLMAKISKSENFEEEIQKIEKQRKLFGEKAVKIPEVKWDDVGGLANAKDDIMQTIMLPIEKPHLFKNGGQRSGLLFYGPPGTGKTLLAKAIATECQMNFISVKGPELLNMYVGESEKNVRQVFERARENLPCIVFFDELDSLAPARGKSSDSSQVMDRIVAQLLTEIDGVGKKPGMFTIGATNRPDLLDSALLRTGRFDKMIYLGVASTVEEKVKIIQAQTRKTHFSDDVQLEKLAKLIPRNFTGADFSALTSEAYMIAVKQKIIKVQQDIESYKLSNNLTEDLLPETFIKLTNYETKVVVTQDNLEQALAQVVPSISIEELQKYEELRSKYSAQ